MVSKVEKNVVVSMAYTLKTKDGEVLDSADREDPFMYLHGHENIVVGLERALDGKTTGDKISTVVSPEDGYGLRDETGMRELPRDSFPPDMDLSPGNQFGAELETGEVVGIWIVDADDKVITVDMNHPLAGEELHFEVEILELRMAREDELQHGHPHSEDGHHHHH